MLHDFHVFIFSTEVNGIKSKSFGVSPIRQDPLRQILASTVFSYIVNEGTLTFSDHIVAILTSYCGHID